MRRSRKQWRWPKPFSTAEGVLDEFERMKLLADAYWTRFIVTGTSKQYDECLAAAERMIAVSEAYAQKHPGEARGYEALSSAYSNAGISRRSACLERAEAFARALGLMRKALVGRGEAGRQCSRITLPTHGDWPRAV